METKEMITIAAAVVSFGVAGISLLRMFLAEKRSDKIKLTNKQTGQSVTISTRPSHQEFKQLLEIVEHD
jgi:Flp pilus assembly protein CpaB